MSDDPQILTVANININKYYYGLVDKDNPEELAASSFRV